MKKLRGVEEVTRRYLRLFPPSSSARKQAAAAADLESNTAAADGEEAAAAAERKPGGWKTMPYIIGNETFERVASFGLTANLTVYLIKRYHMPQVTAANLTNIWSGTTNFAPLLGAFLSDAYWGKFNTLASACVVTFLGMVVMTLTAAVRGLTPAECAATLAAPQTGLGQCSGPTGAQLSALAAGLLLLAVGAGGVRPCNLPFGMDQFDMSTESGRKGMNSYFNLYYTTNTAAVMVGLTAVVYLQDSISWAVGFAVPAALMLLAVALFFVGRPLYVRVAAEGSVFTGIARAFVAAYRKRRLALPSPTEQEATLFDPPVPDASHKDDRHGRFRPPVVKLPLTHQFSFLNKAAIVLDGDLKPSTPGGAGAPPTPSNPWRLCSVQRIEEAKCLIRIVPIWASGITCFVAIGQQWSMAVLQSLTMERNMGPHFQIPPASLGVISLLAIVVFLPIYDRLLVPLLRRLTRHEAGLTLLQRMAVGILVSASSMAVAGAVESRRRRHPLSPAMSVWWLAPQLALVGISEAFNAVGQIEFYNQEFPEQMRSVATSLFWCSLAGAGYLSSTMVAVVQSKTDWLSNANLNDGHLDYFYYLLAAMGGADFIYFLVVARYYRYKGGVGGGGEQQSEVEQELGVLIKPGVRNGTTANAHR